MERYLSSSNLWKNKRAQGLPITTIVIIIIAVVALAVIAIFFFGGFSGSTDSTLTFLNIGEERGEKALCKSAIFGGCGKDTPYCNPTTGDCVASCTDADGDMICDV